MRISDIAIMESVDLQRLVNDVMGRSLPPEELKKVTTSLSPEDLIAIQHYSDKNDSIKIAEILVNAMKQSKIDIDEQVMAGRDNVSSSANNRPATTAQQKQQQSSSVPDTEPEDDNDDPNATVAEPIQSIGPMTADELRRAAAREG